MRPVIVLVQRVSFMELQYAVVVGEPEQDAGAFWEVNVVVPVVEGVCSGDAEEPCAPVVVD